LRDERAVSRHTELLLGMLETGRRARRSTYSPRPGEDNPRVEGQ
jgi:hypothetical protein